MLTSFENDYLHAINALIEERLLPATSHAQSFFAENDLNLASRHLCISDHSKRVRPLLCWFFRAMLDETMDKNYLNIGVAAEFIHAASLLHDDIVDDADKRRGKISANRLFGNAKSVLAGNFLLTEAFLLLQGKEPALIDKAINVVSEMTKAAMCELNTRGRVDISVNDLKHISLGKTGALFAWCGYAAGISCNNNEAAQIFWRAGKRLGIVFQLADDIKDFDGDHHLKDVCRDIRNREFSMPLLLACQADEAIKREFEKAFLRDEIDEHQALILKDLIVNSSAVEDAKKMMQEETNEVERLLDPYDRSRGKILLDDFIENLVD